MALGGLAILAGASFVARSGRVGSAEAGVFRAVNGLPDALYPLSRPAVEAGNFMVGPAITVVALALRRPTLAASAALVTAAKLPAEHGVKKIVHRERPGATIDGAQRRGDVPEKGLSFVSGHALLTAGLATVTRPYLPRRWRWVPPAISASTCTGRLYVGAHNPLDIVGGAALGTAIGAVANLVVGVPGRARG